MKAQYKRDFIQAGALAKEVRSYGKSLIQPGASYQDVIAKINRKIVELGGRAAFPPQIALNDVAAHFLPQPNEEIIFLDQIVKLDVGVCYQGAIGDCAVTVDLSGRYQKLVDAAEAALLAAEKIIKVGLKISEIGRVIESTILSYGFQPIRNLSGHGLGYYQIHTDPLIPNYDHGLKGVIKPGMTFAIEPFATDGKGLIYEAGNPAIFSLISSRPYLSAFPATQKVLAKIKTFNNLPFAIHDLMDLGLSLFDVTLSLTELIRQRVIIGHAPLIEEAHGLVAQAENSVLVDDKGRVMITTR